MNWINRFLEWISSQGRKEESKVEGNCKLFNRSNVSTCSSNTFKFELLLFFVLLSSFCAVCACLRAWHSCQSLEPIVHL